MKPRASIPAIGEIVVHRYVPTHDDIARRAYELWMERGGRHGSHLEDWLLAEEQLKTHAA
ncbi:MAG: DUF2934 domain-containing protein [Sandaracinaceae bacterium]|nr:DUF2934 domain-containing protein [Sandaracinaceae bacterium]